MAMTKQMLPEIDVYI